MTPFGEQLLRIMGKGRSKNAELARLVLQAEGIVVDAQPPGLSTHPEAVRKREQRARKRPPDVPDHVPGALALGHVPDNVPEMSHGGVGGALSLSSSEISDLERESPRASDGTCPKDVPANTAITQSNESSTLDTKPRRRVRDIGTNVPANVPGHAHVRISNEAPLTPALTAVALRCGLAGEVVGHVWTKFCTFYDGKDVEMPKAWRLWCLREKEKGSASTEPPAAETPFRQTDAPVQWNGDELTPEQAKASGYFERLQSTLAKAGLGLGPPIPDARRKAAS